MMTFEDILVETAERLGLAAYASDDSGGATLSGMPAATLDRLKRTVNHARKALYAERQWLWLRTRITIPLTSDGTGTYNIPGDPFRYQLPARYQGPALEPFVLLSSTSTTVPNNRQITQTTQARLDSMIGDGTAVAGPTLSTMVAFDREYNEVHGATVWTLTVWPKPDDSLSIKATLRHSDADLVQLNEIEPCPFPLAVVAYAIFEYVKSGATTQGVAYEQAIRDRDEWKQRLLDHDNRERPSTLGRSVPTTPHYPTFNEQYPFSGTVVAS